MNIPSQHSKILLSSYGFQSPILREKFENVIPRDGRLCEQTCLVVPYAGFNVEKTFEREKQGLIQFGFNPNKIKFARNRFDMAAIPPDYIYVPGGNPFQLLRSLRELEMIPGIIDCVINNGTVYIGVSAGAYIAAKDIAYVTQLEDNNQIAGEEYTALGLLSESILCHYDHYSYATLRACREISGASVLSVKDDQLLKYENGEWEYVGEKV